MHIHICSPHLLRSTFCSWSHAAPLHSTGDRNITQLLCMVPPIQTSQHSCQPGFRKSGKSGKSGNLFRKSMLFKIPNPKSGYGDQHLL